MRHYWLHLPSRIVSHARSTIAHVATLLIIFEQLLAIDLKLLRTCAGVSQPLLTIAASFFRIISVNICRGTPLFLARVACHHYALEAAHTNIVGYIGFQEYT